MASIEELCTVLPLPPEIIDSILTGLSFCHKCQKWTQFASCTNCPATTCSDCSKTCSYSHDLTCRFCQTCAKKMWCPWLKTCICLKWDDEYLELEDMKYACWDDSGNCSQCHEREVCSCCEKTFCCNHFVEIDTGSNEPVLICLEDWANIQARINSDLQSRKIKE